MTTRGYDMGWRNMLIDFVASCIVLIIESPFHAIHYKLNNEEGVMITEINTISKCKDCSTPDGTIFNGLQTVLGQLEVSQEHTPFISITKSHSPNPVLIEAIWGESTGKGTEKAVQAGESVKFICRIWMARKPTNIDPGRVNGNEIYQRSQNKKSVFVYCPLSIAYCAQDCLLVKQEWPIKCAKHYRSFQSYQVPNSSLRLPKAYAWDLREVVYEVRLTTVSSAGAWSCSYGGVQSTELKLRVRDRPILLSLQSEPASPVMVGTAVNLTCQAAPSPNAPWYQFIWYGPDSGIPLSHPAFRISDTVSILILHSVQSSDDGNYSCAVSQTNAERREQHDWWGPPSDMETSHGLKPVDDDTPLNVRSSLDRLQVQLNVFHPPKNISFRTKPAGPFLTGSVITLICHVHDGKPRPSVQFYRVNAKTMAEDAQIDPDYFNQTSSHETIVEYVEKDGMGVFRLDWRIDEKDHHLKFGCLATSVVIPGKMLSTGEILTVIFPPGPPILTAIPQTAVSENRTRIFICRSSRGSNPIATVKWKLITAVDYITSAGITTHTPNRALDRLLMTTNTAHVFQPTEMPDFETDQPGTRRNSPDVTEDQLERGQISHSEARLVSRPWYNGARVSCQLEWFPPSDTGLPDKGVGHGWNLTEFSKPVYLTTEVLFAPTAVSMSADPLGGIQEFKGMQTIECTTVSSIPPAHIEWLRREPVSHQNSLQSHNANGIHSGTLEDPLPIFEGDIPIDGGVTTEMLPGLYGGKRVISRLQLSNVSRSEDGAVFICKVTHVEWTKSVGRMHQLVVLYPPELRIHSKPDTWEKRSSTTHTVLQCVPEGGRPGYPIASVWQSFDASRDSSNLLDTRKRNSSQQSRPDIRKIWRITWTFQPTYPDTLGELSSESVLNRDESSWTQSRLILKRPGRKQVGEYTCRLDGPGGTVEKKEFVNFTFSPELASPKTTAYTASIGQQAVLELYIWAFPFPHTEMPLVEHYSTPTKLTACEWQGLTDQVMEQNSYGVYSNYSWFKATTTGENQHVRIKSRRRLTPLITQTDSNQSPRVLSDLLLINLASINARQLNIPELSREESLNEMRLLLARGIPTLVHRLFIRKVTANDYGEYVCEMEHITGRRSFVVRLQPPVTSSPATRSTKLFRKGTELHLRFNPSIVMPPTSATDGEDRYPEATNIVSPTTSTKWSTETNAQVTSSYHWMILRICTIPGGGISRSEQLSKCSTNHLNSRVSAQRANAPIRSIHQQPQLSRDQESCFDHLIDDPESGSTVIDLTLDNQPHPLKSLLRGGVDTPHATSDVPNANWTMKSRRAHATPQAQRERSMSLINATQLMYQFRIYNKLGSLSHSTQWFHEQFDDSIKETGTKPAVWFAVASVLICIPLLVLFIIVPTIVVRRRRKRKTAASTMMDHTCLSLKNPLGEANHEFFANAIPEFKQDNFYIANSAVVDSPCPMVGRMQKLMNGQLTLNRHTQQHTQQSHGYPRSNGEPSPILHVPDPQLSPHCVRLDRFGHPFPTDLTGSGLWSNWESRMRPDSNFDCETLLLQNDKALIYPEQKFGCIGKNNEQLFELTHRGCSVSPNPSHLSPQLPCKLNSSTRICQSSKQMCNVFPSSTMDPTLLHPVCTTNFIRPCPSQTSDSRNMCSIAPVSMQAPNSPMFHYTQQKLSHNSPIRMRSGTGGGSLPSTALIINQNNSNLIPMQSGGRVITPISFRSGSQHSRHREMINYMDYRSNSLKPMGKSNGSGINGSRGKPTNQMMTTATQLGMPHVEWNCCTEQMIMQRERGNLKSSSPKNVRPKGIIDDILLEQQPPGSCATLSNHSPYDNDTTQSEESNTQR